MENLPDRGATEACVSSEKCDAGFLLNEADAQHSFSFILLCHHNDDALSKEKTRCHQYCQQGYCQTQPPCQTDTRYRGEFYAGTLFYSDFEPWTLRQRPDLLFPKSPQGVAKRVL